MDPVEMDQVAAQAVVRVVARVVAQVVQDRMVAVVPRRVAVSPDSVQSSANHQGEILRR